MFKTFQYNYYTGHTAVGIGQWALDQQICQSSTLANSDTIQHNIEMTRVINIRYKRYSKYQRPGWVLQEDCLTDKAQVIKE